MIFCKREFSNSTPNSLNFKMDKEKQEQGAINTHNYDDVHNVEGEEEEIPDQDEEIHYRRDLPS